MHSNAAYMADQEDDEDDLNSKQITSIKLKFINSKLSINHPKMICKN